MGISHIALAVKNIEATHRFYTDVMGFELVKVEIAAMRGGKARHAFYSTGSADDQMIAFWDLRGVPGMEDGYETDISRGLGLDPFTNHLAFQADSVDDLTVRRSRMAEAGCQVVEIDHGWIQSIYTEDPDGNVVEFAIVTEAFTSDDAAEALDLLTAEDPPLAPEPRITLHQPD
ncbi:MAG: VOC family protein [Actinomycetota bacterium]